MDDLGNVALSFFLVLALMTLRLWELAGLALPLAVMLAVQVGLVSVLCLGPMFRLMGRDYDAAVMSSGFCGFMLGTTANAMANMGSLVERYGPAPKACRTRTPQTIPPSPHFFAVAGGRLRTEEARVLLGVTRSMVLDVARDVLPVSTAPVAVPELPAIAEAFITSASRVLPVSRTDQSRIGNGGPAP